MSFATADICDEMGEAVQVLAPDQHSFGGASSCQGKICTIWLDEDNTGLITMLKEPGDGRVAVVDVGASYCAVVGENLMGFARDNGWAGIIINGYVRDTKATQKIPVGLWALGTCPQKSRKKADAQRDIHLEFGGVHFTPGSYLYADVDGIILLDKAF